MRRCLVSGNWVSQSVASTSLSASRSMSKRSCAVRASTTSSCSVSRSINRVASFASLSTRATYRWRGLCRLLPLPWAKSTIARDSSVRVRLPSSVTEPAQSWTNCSSAVWVTVLFIAVFLSRLARSSSLFSSRVTAASSAETAVLRCSHREWERLRKLARFPLFRGFERFDRARLIEMEHRVELFGQSRPKIVALPLGFGAVDHTDRPLEPGDTQLLRHRVALVQDKQESVA